MGLLLKVLSFRQKMTPLDIPRNKQYNRVVRLQCYVL
jgi:hypothetical protein